ncbi:unnamed protein product [Calypogeia fissa]
MLKSLILSDALLTQGSVEEPNMATEATIGDVNHQQSDHPLTPASQYEVKNDVKSLDLKGSPVDKPKTGTWTAAKFLSGLALSDWQASIGLAVNLATLLIVTYNQPVAEASNTTTNFIGTSFLLTVLGGFIADSYLGAFYTVIMGGIVMTTGLALLTFVVSAPSLQPPLCKTLPTPCSPAGFQYMAPLYAAIYTVALGTGLVRPTLVSLAGEQFDESVPAEKKRILNFFIWFYFFTNVGLVIAFTLGVYLQTYVSHGWGYGFSLMFFVTCFAIFFTGTPLIRRKPPTGSFLTRMAQVFVASTRKTRSGSHLNHNELYDTAPTGKGITKTIRTNKLRFLERAAMMEEEDKKAFEGTGSHRPSPWRLCSVAQVEESKRLLQLVPIWACTPVVTLIFSQLATFTIQQGLTMDRKLGGLDIPAASLNTMLMLATFATVPIYDIIVVPIARKFTGSRNGLTPITRMGISLVFAIMTMVAAGLVERKRLTYVREGHFEQYPLGSYQLPMSFWWLLPQYVLAALVEFFFYPSAFEFFFFESFEGTRNLGSSFTFASAALGYFMSTVLVNIINSVTRHHKGGSWLISPYPGANTEGQLNTGGIEKFYFFLAAFISVGLALYLICAYFYECKYDWYGQESPPALKQSTVEEDGHHKTFQSNVVPQERG